eukprot:g60507.t1
MAVTSPTHWAFTSPTLHCWPIDSNKYIPGKTSAHLFNPSNGTSLVISCYRSTTHRRQVACNETMLRLTGAASGLRPQAQEAQIAFEAQSRPGTSPQIDLISQQERCVHKLTQVAGRPCEALNVSFCN